MDALLRVAGVRKRFGSTEVLQGLDLEVRPGRVVGLLGPNGAGKTTLIRMVLDLTLPDAGAVTVLGESPSARLRDRIGYLPEERGLYPKQRVVDVLAYLVSLAGVAPAEARRRSEAWLKRVGLGEHARKKVRQLSKGMQQKVQLGAAILHAPDLLILDEPFTGLDPVNRRLVGDVVREQAARGAGVIVSTHLLDQAQQLCDEVVLIRLGRMLLTGPLDTVRRTWAEGRVEIVAEGPWADDPRVAAQVEAISDEGEPTRVTLREGVAPEDFLATVLAAGGRVEHFSRPLPSLEEVFVRAVEADTAEDAARVRAELHAGAAAPGDAA